MTAPATGLSPALLALRDALTTIDERPPLVAVEVPVITVSEANAHAHWRQRAKRAQTQRTCVGLALASAKYRLRDALGGWGGLVVRLVRVAPRGLDSDNLAGALKACRDAVAEVLGVDDRDARVVWVPDEAKGPAGVRVEVYPGRAHGR